MIRSFAIAALLTLSTGAAFADEMSTPVAYGDLNLSRPGDAKILADRLNSAARNVCFQTNADIGSAAVHTCTETAVATAMSEIASHLHESVHAELDNVRTAMQSP